MNEFQEWLEHQRKINHSDFPDISEEVEKWLGYAYYAGEASGRLEGYLLAIDELGDGE